jgi:hypothetical protein
MQFRTQRTLLWAVAIAGLLSLLGVLASFYKLLRKPFAPAEITAAVEDVLGDDAAT